jgi:prepilin-type N-terminal cleavage/methylation domain-containing protein
MRRRAFTLPELLVVIGIIVVLVAMLLPAINRAWNQAQLVNCQSNLRQIGLAVAMYENEYHGYLPFANWNWDPAPVSFYNATAGWLYACPLPSGPIDPSYVQTGNLWPYLQNQKVYHCPIWVQGDMGWINNDRTDTLTSYLMNGSMCAFGTYAGPQDPTTSEAPAYFFKVTKFQPDDVVIWESAEQDKAAWNDGATQPEESYNPAITNGNHSRHGKNLPLLSIDGHVETISVSDYWALASQTASGQPYGPGILGVKNRLWCNPLTSDGHCPYDWPF